MAELLLLAYASCDTCRKARKWLETHKLVHTVRPIVEQPPTVAELRTWIPASEKSVRQWLNTSGQSYRALGKAAIDALSDEQVLEALSADGKLVKRPVLVAGSRVLVGFDQKQYEQLLSSPSR